MINRNRMARMNRLMWKEIRDMCYRFEIESGEVRTHVETDQEKVERLKKKECERKQKERWTLHTYTEI